MPRLVYLDDAKVDLRDILNHITADSGSRAIGRGYVEKIRAKIRTFAALPGPFGRPRPELREGLRSMPHVSHIIFFRYGQGTLEVVNVPHASRDFDDFFGQDAQD